MANFVEQATLKVNDQSSAQIRKINAELKKLDATAKSLKSKTINFNVNAKGIAQANAQLRTLHSTLSSLRSTRINISVNASGLRQAQNQIARLHAMAARPSPVNARQRAAPPPPPPRVGPGVGAGRGGAMPPPPRVGPGGGGTGGPFNAMTSAAYAATHALNSMAGAAGRLSTALAAYAAYSAVKKGGEGVLDSEDARTRMRQAGFTDAQVDYFSAAARQNQEEFNRVPAAKVLSASVEQLGAVRANKGTREDYEVAMRRIASNSQVLAATYKSLSEGAEGARQLERLSQVMGKDVQPADIAKIHKAAIQAIVATGGEIKPEETVRTAQQLGSSVAKTITPKGIRDLIMMRDEGGRASTAEWRIAVQELQRGTLKPSRKRLMAKAGLRQKSGDADPEVVKEASANLVDAVEKRIIPKLPENVRAGTSAEVATYLDTKMGFNTSAARGIADIVTSLRSGEIQRQREMGDRVNVDPHIGDNTFRGGADAMVASFQTGLARPLDKMGPVFVEAITPFRLAMDEAGKQAEKGEYAGATGTMAKAALDVAGGPVGQILTAISGFRAMTTLLDPTASPVERGAALLVTGSQALLVAAGAISKSFAEKDAAVEAKRLKGMADVDIPRDIEEYKRQEAEEQAKGGRNKSKLAAIRMKIEAAERAQIDAGIEAGKYERQAEVDRANAAAKKAQQAEEIEKLWQKAGLQPPDAATKQAITGANQPAQTSRTLDDLKKDPKTAGLNLKNSVVDMMKALGMGTGAAVRKELAAQLGITGKAGSAQVNTALLNWLRSQIDKKPEDIKPTEVKPPEPKPTEVKPPEPKPTEVKPPEPKPIELKPIDVTPTTPPVTPAGAPGSSMDDIKRMLEGAGQPILAAATQLSAAGTTFASAFGAGAASINSAAASLGAAGSIAASAIAAGASGAGSAYGAAAAAQISAAAAHISINVNNTGGAKGDPGGQKSTSPGTG